MPVIPAQAGIHVATVKVKMDPRFRGDDMGTGGGCRLPDMTIRPAVHALYG
jgi:hypothetical protein